MTVFIPVPPVLIMIIISFFSLLQI